MSPLVGLYHRPNVINDNIYKLLIISMSPLVGLFYRPNVINDNIYIYEYERRMYNNNKKSRIRVI
jgi:hypothetical protein